MALPEVPDWTQLIQLMGQYDSTPTLVAVDANGNIIAIMKGEYAGVLKSIAVDAAGRVIMIPTDPADVWGNAISMGNAELAARLTGMGGFDRRGNAILADTFEGGLNKGEITLSGTGAEVVLSSDSALQGSFSAKMVAGSDSGKLAYYKYYLPYPVLGKIGLEVSFTVESNTDTIVLGLHLYDGTDLRLAHVRYVEATEKIQYYTDALDWQDLITSTPLYENDHYFHTIKMVIDFENDKYHRVLVDGWSWTDADLDIHVVSDSTAKSLFASIAHYADAGHNPASYVDRVLITQNEEA